MSMNDSDAAISLIDYQSLCAQAGPAPTPEQIDAYVAYLASKHSWYKHLPLTPPGVPWLMFVDPNAGLRLVDDKDGMRRFAPIGENDLLWHYSMRRTRDYRNSFGMLNAVLGGQPGFSLLQPDGSAEHIQMVPGIVVDGMLRNLPLEVACATTVEVTGVIHPYSSQNWLWEELLGMGPYAREGCSRVEGTLPLNVASKRWPEATGGAHTLSAIAAVLENPPCSGYGNGIEGLIAPERERLLRQVRQACQRAVKMAFPATPVSL